MDQLAAEVEEWNRDDSCVSEKALVFLMVIFQDAKESKTAAQKKEGMKKTLALWREGEWDLCVREALLKEVRLQKY